MNRDLNVDQIKKLWILDLIVRSGSLKKAALSAKVSPSAISQTLTALETSVGKPLLVRDRGMVTPTQDALAILGVVRPVFEALDRLQNLKRTPVPKISWLNFGTYESLAVDILPGLVHALKTKMPTAKLGLRVCRTDQLLSMVRKGELCSALIAEVDDLDRFYRQEVYEDRLGFFVSNRHPIAELGWAAVSEYGVGSLAPGSKGFPRYFTKFMRQFADVKPYLTSDSFETLRASAAAGAIVALLPKRVANRSGDLLEVTPKSRSLKEEGRHKIFVVSQSNCDREETDFLADEVRNLLDRK